MESTSAAEHGAPPPLPPPPPMLGKPYDPTLQANKLPHYFKSEPKFDAVVPMKMANWTKLDPQKMSENSFWAKCQEDKLASEDVFAGLAAKFPSKPAKNKMVVTLNTKKDAELRVIDRQTAQRILILLHTLLKNVSHEKIKQSILRCDTSILKSDIIQQLIQSLPPPYQIERIKEIGITEAKLSEAEIFIATLGEIQDFVPRLHGINFRLNIADMVRAIEPNITDGIAACEEVKNSKKFAKIIELVLLFGNYMNSKSMYGQAHGFDISFLTKLKDTKDLNNEQTLIHYLVETIETNYPEVLNFGEELQHAKNAVRISFKSIRAIMVQMTTLLERLKSQLENCKVPQTPDDKFAEVMADFAVQSNDQLDVLMKMMHKMENCYEDLGQYFTFDTKKYPIEDFFSDIKMFKVSFAEAHKEILIARESQEKNEMACQTRKPFKQLQIQPKERSLNATKSDSNSQ